MAIYLVTGNAGFIGSAIANKLLENNHTVYGIDNLNTGYSENVDKRVHFIKDDFSKDETLAKLKEVKFDTIFHIGGQSSGEISFENPEYDLSTNTLSTLKLLKYAVKTGCKKFIYASTMSVYGEEASKEQFSEQDKTNPKSFYAVGKLASEKYIEIFQKEYGIDSTVLRYFNVYGPGQNLDNMKQGMVSIYLKQFLDDTYKVVEVKGDINRFRDLIYIDDIVSITIDAAYNRSMSNQVLNVGTAIKTEVGEILKYIQEYTESEKDIIISSGTPGDQFGIYADNQKLLSMYKNNLIDFKTGLRNMIIWINENSE